jgi:hypothetical protein
VSTAPGTRLACPPNAAAFSSEAAAPAIHRCYTRIRCGGIGCCNALFDGSPLWKIEPWIKVLVLLRLWLWRMRLGPFSRKQCRIDRSFV